MLARASACAYGWLASLDGLGEESVELGGGNAPSHAVAQRERLGQQARDVAPSQRARGQYTRAQAQLFCTRARS